MKTNIYVTGTKIADILRTVPPPPELTCDIISHIPITPEQGASSIFIIKNFPETLNNSVKYVLCTKSPQLLTSEKLRLLYDLWPEPLTPTLLRYNFARMLTRLASDTEHHHKMVEMARQDYLTGLATRWYLDEFFSHNKDAKHISCIFFDLDNFKNVNDTHGHEAGDRALAATAELLQQEFPDGFSARMGGDEFMTVLIGHYEASDVQIRVNSFMNKLLDYYASSPKLKNLSISAGISQNSQKDSSDGKSIDTLIHEADTALYAAKNSGRSRCVIYSPELAHEKHNSSPADYYLVDYENVHSRGLDGLHKLGSNTHVIIFYSRNASSITSRLNLGLISSKAQITYHHVEAGTKNALDFQLSSYLGELIGHNKNARESANYYIVSHDTGYSSLIPFWRERGVNLTVIPDIHGHDTQALSELAQRVKLLTGDELNAQAIAEIITHKASKVEINTELQRLYRSNKSAEIYHLILSLIADKPGQPSKQRVL